MQASKAVTPTETAQTVTPDTGFDGMKKVNVGAISSTYVGTGIARKSAADLTANGATVTVPVGYYSSAVTKNVGTADAFPPALSLNSSTGVITGTNTFGAGYYAAGTSTSTLQLTTRSAADLTASGSKVTAPAGYYSTSVSKAIGAGTATTPGTTITANPTITVNANGLITATATASSSITPTVSAGYVAAGTAGTVSVTGTKTSQLTSKAAATYNTSTANQTIASAQYLTGIQTIRGVTTSNISAANIKTGVTIKVGDSADDDRIAGVAGTFTAANTVTSGQTAAAAGQILSGYSGWVDGAEVKGNIATKTASNLTASGSTVTVPAGYYATQVTKNVASVTHANPTASISATTGLVTATHTQTAGYVAAGTTTGTLQLTTQGATTITPSATSQTAVSAGTYVTGNITVEAASEKKYTFTITSTTAYRTRVTYNGTTYSTAGASFEFSEGDTCEIGVWGEMAGSTVYEDGTSIGTSDSGAYLTYILPARDVNLSATDYQAYLTTIKKYKARITSGSNNNVCCVQYNNIKYSSKGDIFEFAAGDSLIVYVDGRLGGGTFYVNDDIIASSQNPITYTYTLPSRDITIVESYDSGGVVRINAPILSITENGTYDVVDYASTEVSVAVNIPAIYTSLINRQVVYSSTEGASELFNSLISFSSGQFANQPFSGDFVFSNVTSLNYFCFGSVTTPGVAVGGSYSHFFTLSFPKLTQVTHVGAFAYNEGITAIYLPSCVYIDGTNAFVSCINLTTVSAPKCISLGNSEFYGCAKLSTASFPSCTRIGTNTFANCTSLATISFPICTSIGTNAFANCTSLATISFPSCTTIGTSAFSNCTNLTTISFPSCTTVGASAFYNCTKLSIASFSKCTTIGSSAFGHCYSLITASFPSCTTIGSYAFTGCSSLTTISFPVCTTISSNAFGNCSSLTTAIFPSCSSVGNMAFYCCYSLKTASFPSCTFIGNSAFYSCYNLISLYLTGSTVPTLSGAYGFRSTPIGGYSTSAGQYGSVFVPSSLYATYIAATGWSSISARIVSI